MFKRLCFTTVFFIFCASTVQASQCQELGTILRGSASQVDNVCDVFVPRNDIISHLANFVLQPGIGIGLEAAFIPVQKKNPRVIRAVDGEIALLEDEINLATNYLRRNGFDITALHNHYIGENPKIMFMHFSKQGKATHLARELRGLLDLIGGFDASVFPFTSDLDAHAINRVLKLKGKIAENGVYRADFQRPFTINDQGAISEPECLIAIEGTMNTALLVGEIALKVKEIQPFIDALLANGFDIAAQHNHELTEKPRVYYIHFEQFNQSAISLARAAKQVLNTIKVEKEGQ